MTNINWWTTTSCHGLDFVFMFIEFSLSRWVLKVPYLILVLFISVTYMFWAWIIYAIYNNWVYGFLDWYRPTGAVLGGYLGVTAAFVVVCFFMYGLHYTREYIARRFFPQEKSADFCVIDTGSKECVEVNI
ncbi:hypothetical protein K7432_007836 [Basidiobolus ranarum]|uniref:Uncharacterized protein n=1 Tax=Basidiobolus ranarum TaxID=34480 RepID=A0ABR2WSR7_9FUNG